MDKQVVIGTIIAPHGVRGDIRILPQTENPEQFLKLKSLILNDGQQLQVTAARFHKRMVLVKCQGIDDMNTAELLRGKTVLINSADLPKLKPNTYYVADLLGLPVVDEAGVELGTLKEVISTGSNDVYVIKTSEGKDILVPALKKHIKEINLVERRIVVQLPEWTDEQ